MTTKGHRKTKGENIRGRKTDIEIKIGLRYLNEVPEWERGENGEKA